MTQPQPKKQRSTKTPPNPESEKSLALAREMAGLADDKKGTDISILHVESLVSYADYFVIATGANRRQVQAIADAVEAMVKETGTQPRVEGYASGWWVLLEFRGVILHVFQEDARAFYGLDHLWADAERVNSKDRGAGRRRSRITSEF